MLSLKTVNSWSKVLSQKVITLEWIIDWYYQIWKFPNLVTVDNDVAARKLGEFPEMNPGWKIFFNLSMFDIQWENKSY